MNANTQTAIELVKHCHRGGSFGMFWQSQGKRSTWYEIGKPAKMPLTPNTYFGINPSACIPTTNSAGQSAAPEYIATQNNYIAAVNCFFAEFDAKDFGGKEQTHEHVQGLHVSPSVVIDSGGGYHTYWLFDQPVMIADDVTRAIMIQAQMDWVMWMGGDKGARDLRRVLRVPGTMNIKYDPYREVVALDTNWELFESQFLIDLCRVHVEPIKRSEALGRVGVTSPPQRQYSGDGLIEKFNAQIKPQELLRQNGYALNRDENRFTRPGKSAKDGISGVVSDSGGKARVFTFSSNDPLFSEEANGKRHTLDSFDLFVKLQHGGDMAAAIQAAKELVR